MRILIRKAIRKKKKLKKEGEGCQFDVCAFLKNFFKANDSLRIQKNISVVDGKNP